MLTTTGPTLSSARWQGDYLDREHLVPGGATVDAAQFTAGSDGKKYIPSGTILGRTYAERDAGTGYGPAADTDDEFFLVAFDVSDAGDVADVELYRHGSIVYENFLPVTFSTNSATIQAAIRSAYQCSIAQA
jgi:hypothetical protein